MKAVLFLMPREAQPIKAAKRRQIVASRARGCCSNGGVTNFPLLSEEGWLRDQEKVAKHPKLAQTGWCSTSTKFLELDHHPVRSIEEASRYFVEVASTPPRRGGEKKARPQLLPYVTIASSDVSAFQI